MVQKRFLRGAGVLLPIFSLPGKYGIGDFGDMSYRFVDFLAKAGQKYWQILPLNPTGYGDSPYASHSAFAGNAYFIPLDENAIEQSTFHSALQLEGGDVSRIDYARLYQHRTALFDSMPKLLVAEYEIKQYFEKEEYWLKDYALYSTIKRYEGGRSWVDWRNQELRNHEKEALSEFGRAHVEEIDRVIRLQYLFDRSWKRLRAYANMRGISVIGDIPLYVALDSADVWAHRELFQLDADGLPSFGAGVPPDEFSVTGQLWGNPIYRWKRMKEDGFLWWRKRIEQCAEMYDAVRIDHFIGICRYYAIPRESKDARSGAWKLGPGKELLNALISIGLPIIAEDLGELTQEVEDVKVGFGIPGMKILQFAFDGNPQNPYLPHHYERNSIVYGGTHDNETLGGYFSARNRPISYAAEYLGTDPSPNEVVQGCIRAGLASVSDIAIFTLADWLGLDNRARINTPSIPFGNWQWRIGKEMLSQELALKMRQQTLLYSR